jgi:hypothetical protein
MYSLESRQHGHRTSRGIVSYVPTEANRRVPISPMESYGNNSMRPLPVFSNNPDILHDTSTHHYSQISDSRLKQPDSSAYGQLNNYEKGEWMSRMKELHGTPGVSSEERNAYAKKALADYMPYYANTGGNLQSANMTNLFK